MTRPKNKTLATWLTFLGGPLGLHRFYLKGFGDLLGWMLPIPTALGLYGVERVQRFGQDDQWSWLLIPMLGFTIAACALMAIIYGLMTPEKWNARFNPQLDPEAAPCRPVLLKQELLALCSRRFRVKKYLKSPRVKRQQLQKVKRCWPG